MKLTKQKIDLLTNGTREERVYACAKSFKLFCVFYYSRYFRYQLAPFHDDFYQDFEDLVYGRIKDAAWVAYRESAKTSIAANMGLSWIAARKKVIDGLAAQGENVDHWGVRRYVNVDCYDKANAENILFDLVTELQTNDLLIADFGHLFNAPRSSDQKDLKRVEKFNTTSGVRFEAHTALTPTRGRKVGTERPDFRLGDDLENAITAESPAVTEKIIRVLSESKAGLPDYSASLTLGNYISEQGVVAYIMKLVAGAGGRVRFIPVVDKQGNISWPDKYVKTDAEAAEVNAGITDPSKRKISLESKKRELNAGGRRIYEVEMMLDPVAAGSPFFDRAAIERLIAQCTESKEVKAGFHIWADYNPSHRYAIGADTGKGNGGDHSTSCLIDFSTVPARQIGSYANNMIPADQFAYELKRQADLFGSCLVAPEKNSESGGSCLTTLKMIYDTNVIYRQVPLDRISDQPLGSGELGWETNSATKYTILNDLRTAVEDGLLIINDERILREMKSFTHTDADDLGRSRVGHFTNHFDLLMAIAIAWEMRKHAKAKGPTSTYEQEPYERTGL
ncbi:hypothetical protein EDE08_101648 [Bradyrhizobium sp. R2.2-H]|jgi:hypothetical protein|uniref:hypothetical protein n=1 Tax=unclassified Bradyrhizobium TaxID=2631580 RepID=UPI00105007C5|nr:MULTISPECIES: hypothetical protein [unclassified Bradyrhizobium]TCU78866.1 hypothetical protein EDE10_101649 [Bradyrhizobium sp. Y-H1]TCU80949.1 hypothetical protein EDE08_101648 [Bradyrhizobium sp. R2.2-H]